MDRTYGHLVVADFVTAMPEAPVTALVQVTAMTASGQLRGRYNAGDVNATDPVFPIRGRFGHLK